jgi:hypothetical protein
MNGKWSTATLSVTTLVALVAGFFIAKIMTAPSSTTRATAQTVKAIIKRNSSDNSCQQYAGSDFGHVVKYAYPLLNRGDKIVWRGQVDGAVPKVKVEVHFNPASSPFGSSNTFNEDQPSPAVDNSVASGDYPFSAASVDGTPCASFSDPGVHVN